MVGKPCRLVFAVPFDPHFFSWAPVPMLLTVAAELAGVKQKMVLLLMCLLE